MQRVPGHFGRTRYHPLFVFNQFGDVERCALRPGNVHSAAGWRAVLGYQGIVKRLYFRGDPGFAAITSESQREVPSWAFPSINMSQ
jgi:hypothetical protein